MTSHARHNERVRLAPNASTDTPSAHSPSFDTQPLPRQRTTGPSNVTWVVAAAACLAAFAIKISQPWFEQIGDAGKHADLSAAFDWTALILCICALALLSFQRTPHTRTASQDHPANGNAGVSPNIAMPNSADARLRLAHSLSHELRTPLNAVIGFSDLMTHQLHGNLGHPKYNEYCAHISTSSQSLLRAVDDILALNAGQTIDIRRRVPLPVAVALQTAWEENYATSPPVASCHANLNIDGDRHRQVIADPEILSHALKNILAALARQSARGTTVSAVIGSAGGKTRICCSIEFDGTGCVETAPLAARTGGQPVRRRPSRDTLTEAAAEALVRSMDGNLTISQLEGPGRLEIICDLPAPRTGNDPTIAERLAA